MLERAAELQRLAEAIEAARAGTGRLIVVEGEAGIGKSTLVAAAVEQARRGGLRVAQARANELERSYPFGVALGLFEPLAGDRTVDRAELFTGAARAAEPLITHGAEGTPLAPGMVGDPFATVHGLYWVAVNAAEMRPLVVVVDDAQWSDEGSLRFLHYLAQRVDELPILLLLAFRTSPAADEEPARSLRTSPAAIVIEPRPLSERAVGELLAGSGIADPDGTLRAEYWATTRGNPLFLAELVRDRAERDAVTPRPSRDEPVPGGITRVVEARIARLDPDAQRVAEAVAVLGDQATLHRAAHLAEIPEAEANRVIRALARAVIVDPGEPLDFVHPIVRAAIYGAIPPATRGRLHRVAGILLHDEVAPLGVIGTQLLEASRTGDPRVVDLLRAAAAEASARGQPGVAAQLLERARAEPPANGARLEVLVELARAHATVGSPDAIRHYWEVVDLVDESIRRAGLLLELGHALIAAANWADATTAFERGLKELAGASDPSGDEATVQQLHDQLEAGFASAAWVGIDRHADAERVVARMLGEERLGDVHRQLAVWAAFQRTIVASGTAAQAAELVERAIGGIPAEQLIGEGQIVEVAAGVLVATDEHPAEIELLSRAIAAAEGVEAYGKVGMYSYCRALPNYFTGALTDAIADAQAASRTAELGWETFLPGARAMLAHALIERGDLDGAAEALVVDRERWGGRVDFEAFVPVARCRLALVEGRLDEALAHADEGSIVPLSIGLRGLVPPSWRAWKAMALTQLGRRGEARELAEEDLVVARAWGARWSLGGALRIAGIAAGGTTGIDLLRESADLLETSPARLEHATTRTELGSALRRGGYLPDARRELTAAMDLSHRLGALGLLERARAELRAAGSRPRRYALTGVAALTPAELRVARLAAEGRTNRQIAQALFVTPKAVEYHLANAYPKLGIASRQELAPALARDPGDRSIEAAT